MIILLCISSDSNPNQNHNLTKSLIFDPFLLARVLNQILKRKSIIISFFLHFLQLHVQIYSILFNPILGGGGGKFTLSALYRVKSPESRHKVGVMGYQNSSWDICDLTKKVSGPKNF